MANKKIFISAVITTVLSICAAAAYKFSVELPTFEKITTTQLPYLVIRINAGDTIMVDANGQQLKIKMIGITSAEKYGGKLAAFTKNLLRGETVCIIKDANHNEPNNAEAAFGYIYRMPDGLFVNAEIIRQGYAKADKTATFKYAAEFQQLEKFARERGKGIWDISEETQTAIQPQQKIVSQPANTYTKTSATPRVSQNTTAEKDIVYVTKTGKKYHRSGCSFLSKSSTAIKIENAKAKGYTPCSKCCK